MSFSTPWGYDVIAEADSHRNALGVVERLVPDGVLVDVHLGDECGLQLARALTCVHPDLVVLLTSAIYLERSEGARTCGACGFVPRSGSRRSTSRRTSGANGRDHPVGVMPPASGGSSIPGMSKHTSSDSSVVAPGSIPRNLWLWALAAGVLLWSSWSHSPSR